MCVVLMLYFPYSCENLAVVCLSDVTGRHCKRSYGVVYSISRKDISKSEYTKG